MENSTMIGNRVTEARKKINLSKAQLAERLFISPQAVGKWERGESMPDITTFSRLAELLGVDLNYFSEKFSNHENLPSSDISSNATLDNTPLPAEKLNWDMSEENWVDADFSGLKNLQDKFSSSNMRNCKFLDSDFSGLHLKGNNVVGCDFSNSNFQKSHIQGSHLSENKFNNCHLQETDFSTSHIKACDFSNANLTGVHFKTGVLEKCTLKDALWKRTSFISMHLSEITFDGRIEDCYFDNSTFRKVIFREATLINTFFKGKSLKRLQFLDCSADRMTYEFLKNGKADVSGVKVVE